MKYNLILESWKKFLTEEETLAKTTTEVENSIENKQEEEEQKIKSVIAAIKSSIGTGIQSQQEVIKTIPNKQAIKDALKNEIDSLSLQEAIEEAKKRKRAKVTKKKKSGGDRCTRIAKRKYDVWPSAYASGAVVKCRQGKIWKGVSESATDEEIDNELLLEEIEVIEEKQNNQLNERCWKGYTQKGMKTMFGKRYPNCVKVTKESVDVQEEDILEEKWSEKYKSSIDCKNPKGFSQKAHCQGRKKNEELELDDELVEEAKKKAYKPNFSKEKEQGLHGWFARNNGKGWVNCRTGGPCGRDSSDKGGKYPACRPTKAQCKSAGKGPLRKKKSSKPISWTKKKKKD